MPTSPPRPSSPSQRAKSSQQLILGDTVLLFFGESHVAARIPRRQYPRQAAARLRRRLLGQPTTTGFHVWRDLLVTALKRRGFVVRMNDYALARRNPVQPVGILGYPGILQGWDLPNPAVLGPGLYDHPLMAPRLMEDQRFFSYVLTCDWMREEFRKVYPDAKCALWNAGIDTEYWRDLSGEQKTVDVLIYDKIRWDRDTVGAELLATVESTIDARGLTRSSIRYGKYDYRAYKRALASTRALVFLCEHETQGMAYQEALASGVPVIAWVPGVWKDPNAQRFSDAPISTTSVPYFDERCGTTFRNAGSFPEEFRRFWHSMAAYQPRDFVHDALSMSRSADLYLDIYFGAAGVSGRERVFT